MYKIYMCIFLNSCIMSTRTLVSAGLFCSASFVGLPPPICFCWAQLARPDAPQPEYKLTILTPRTFPEPETQQGMPPDPGIKIVRPNIILTQGTMNSSVVLGFDPWTWTYKDELHHYTYYVVMQYFQKTDMVFFVITQYLECIQSFSGRRSISIIELTPPL